jgi:hypothetical protein
VIVTLTIDPAVERAPSPAEMQTLRNTLYTLGYTRVDFIHLDEATQAQYQNDLARLRGEPV